MRSTGQYEIMHVRNVFGKGAGEDAENLETVSLMVSIKEVRTG